jgi:NAD(P)-dependent dehydrogenase (short-subunit alcohol dehydrogenase family)
VNFLSAFLLTLGLEEVLAAGRGRVVHMSSGVHSSGSVDLEQPDEPRYATPYAQSKIALVMLAREQGERWRQLGVDVNACSPGWIATKMGGTGGGSLAEGVDTPLWLLTDPGLAGTTGGSSGSDTRKSPTRKSRMARPGLDCGTSPSCPSGPRAGERRAHMDGCLAR